MLLHASFVVKEISDEFLEHGDILQEDFLDSYSNLTLKTIGAIKWARKLYILLIILAVVFRLFMSQGIAPAIDFMQLTLQQYVPFYVFSLT